jgi:hypothetical protein
MEWIHCPCSTGRFRVCGELAFPNAHTTSTPNRQEDPCP